MKLRAYLARLYLAAIVPLAILAAVLIYQVIANEQRTVQQSMINVARTLSSAVDAEVGRSILALEMLAQSEAIDAKDWGGLREQAERMRQLHGRWSNVVMGQLDGQRVLNLRVPAKAQIPTGNDSAAVEEAQLGRRFISDVTVSVTSGQPTVYVSVPVVRGGRPQYFLAATMESEVWTDWLKQQIPPGAIAAIDDRKGMIFARSERPEGFVGKRAADPILQSYSERREGLVRSKNRQGLDIYAAFYTSALSGWHTLVILPASVVNEGATRFAWGLGGAALLVLLVTAIASLVVARPLEKGIGVLRQAIARVGRGERPESAPIFIQELDEANLSAAEAAQLLDLSQQALKNRTAQFEALLAGAPLGVYLIDADFRVVEVNPEARRIFGNRPVSTVLS